MPISGAPLNVGISSGRSSCVATTRAFDKMQHCIIFFTELSVKKDLFYIDARARYAVLKEQR